MSETNAQGQSPLNEGTNRDHPKPAAPNVNVDPDLSPTGGPQAEEAPDSAEQDAPDPMTEEDTASGGAPER